jgi:cysteine-rich repeat protein
LNAISSATLITSLVILLILSTLFFGKFWHAETLRQCGNGIVEVGEQCDDGNANNYDGCTVGCGILRGWTCTGSTSLCTHSCGNGILQRRFGEQCDDGNTDSGDGCTSACQIETGFVCAGAPSLCRCMNTPAVCGLLHCGDGILDPGEECDDGNKWLKDGCNKSCVIERGFQCRKGSPSVCSLLLQPNKAMKEEPPPPDPLRRPLLRRFSYQKSLRTTAEGL